MFQIFNRQKIGKRDKHEKNILKIAKMSRFFKWRRVTNSILCTALFLKIINFFFNIFLIYKARKKSLSYFIYSQKENTQFYD